MKTAAAISVALVTLSTLAAASQHNHRHAHLHNKKRDITTVTVDGPVEVAYVFEGEIIPVSAVCEGLKNGTFEWAQDSTDQPNCDASAPSPSPASSAASSPSPLSSSVAGDEFVQGGHPASSVTSAPTPASSPSSGSSSSGSSSGISGTSGTSISGLSGYYAQIATNNNVDVEFPDGEVDCSEFPSNYGAVPVSYLNLNGWTGIQNTVITNGIPGEITTATSGGCSSEGSGNTYCSYACPAGYMKSQFPAQNSGTSVGGLQCGSDGKLHKTNSGFNTLCIKGAGSASVTNNLDGVVCVCGTDYPGKWA